MHGSAFASTTWTELWTCPSTCLAAVRVGKKLVHACCCYDGSAPAGLSICVKARDKGNRTDKWLHTEISNPQGQSELTSSACRTDILPIKSSLNPKKADCRVAIVPQFAWVSSKIYISRASVGCCLGPKGLPCHSNWSHDSPYGHVGKQCCGPQSTVQTDHWRCPMVLRRRIFRFCNGGFDVAQAL